jgi:hypothetical protein
LLKGRLTNWLYGDHELVSVSPQGPMTPDQFGTLAVHGMRLVKQNAVAPHERSGGYPYLLLHNHFKYGLRVPGTLFATCFVTSACGKPLFRGAVLPIRLVPRAKLFEQ